MLSADIVPFKVRGDAIS